MSGPMDSAVERVARALVKLDDHHGHEALLMSLRATLLAHDHWEKRAKAFERQVSDLQGREQVAWESHLATLERERAKTKRYRSRCPVTAEDAKRLTGDKIAAWMLATCDWFEVPSSRARIRIFSLEGSLDQLTIGMGPPEHWADSTRVYLDAVRREAKRLSRPELDILDEMAAMDTGAEVDS